HDQNEHDAQNAVHDGAELSPLGVAVHVVRSSTPVAYRAPSRVSSRMRDSGRRGGPASGRPVARSNTPTWHGQRIASLATSGRTAHARCVQRLEYATNASRSRRM